MNDAGKLTVYFGESDRVGGRLLSDVLVDLFDEAGVRAAVLMRGVEGFGVKHQLHTDRLLTLSEDLPLVALAIAERERIDELLPRVTELVPGGLVTAERARLLRGTAGAELPEDLHEAAKLTLYLGRDEPYREVVEHLRRAGVAGATVLLGLDGIVHGRRHRARFFARNASVPLLVISLGTGEAVDRALAGLDALVPDTATTLERVRVCKRDGTLLAEPHVLDEGVWQKLTVYAGEQARHAGHPLHVQLVHRLREARAGGATALRGTWGFSGDHLPHGDRVLQIRRRVPVVTTVVDTPDRIRQWFRIVDELTDEAGLVTSELVPTSVAIGPRP